MAKNITMNANAIGDMEKEKLKDFLTHLKNISIVYESLYS